jgi:16S rRNA (uracil1498-N3)-methyltransferase
MQLFFNPSIDSNTKEFTFDKNESKHITKVLRKSEGDLLNITNGKGVFFEVLILDSNPKKCMGKMYTLHLAVAPTKLNDRYEWFLEKATEIGITEITPILCDHSERKIIKLERFEKKIQSAMKQSLKAYLPKLNKATTFNDFLKLQKKNPQQKLIAHCEKTTKQSLKSVLKKRTHTTILIGPEGDFSIDEINKSIGAGFIPVSLGKSRLRTETAALVACHSVSFIND